MSGTGLGTLGKLILYNNWMKYRYCYHSHLTDEEQRQERLNSIPMFTKLSNGRAQIDASSDSTQTWPYLSGASGHWHPPRPGSDPGDWLNTRKLLLAPWVVNRYWRVFDSLVQSAESSASSILDKMDIGGCSMDLSWDTWTLVDTAWTLALLPTSCMTLLSVFTDNIGIIIILHLQRCHKE